MTFKQTLKFTLIALIVPVVAACAPSGSSQQITSIPTSVEEATATATLAATNTPVTIETEEVTNTPVEVAAADATPTPASRGLQPGESRAIARATDQGMKPTPNGELIEFGDEIVPMTFDDFYDGFDIRRGLLLSDKLISLDGHRVSMEGYMAPPLKPALDWFVLTRVPLALCPFCSTDADWPTDIALVYMPDGETTLATDRPLRIIGTMEVGSSTDAETGMVSVVRIYAERFETVNQ